MTPEKLKSIIEVSLIPDDLKQRLNLILPNLDKNLLFGLGMELGRRDSLPIAFGLTRRFENYAGLLQGIKKGNKQLAADFLKQLEEVAGDLNDEEKSYFLYLVLDIRSASRSLKSIFSETNFKRIIDYEISLFWELPKSEVIYLLQNHLLLLEKSFNLLLHIQVICWENDWNYGKNFSQSFGQLLLQNKEILGQPAGKTVGAWIQECLNFSLENGSQISIVKIAEFLVKNAAVQKLKDAERKTLSQILKLYEWFLDPQIDEDEVLQYKEELRAKESERINQLLSKAVQEFKADSQVIKPFEQFIAASRPMLMEDMVVPGLSFRPPNTNVNKTDSIASTIPIPPVPSFKPKVGVNIDQKLEELKKRRVRSKQ